MDLDFAPDLAEVELKSAAAAVGHEGPSEGQVDLEVVEDAQLQTLVSALEGPDAVQEQ